MKLQVLLEDVADEAFSLRRFMLAVQRDVVEHDGVEMKLVKVDPATETHYARTYFLVGREGEVMQRLGLMFIDDDAQPADTWRVVLMHSGDDVHVPDPFDEYRTVRTTNDNADIRYMQADGASRTAAAILAWLG